MFGLKKAKERQRRIDEIEDQRMAEYRRAHLVSAAQFAIGTKQEGPAFHGAGTVTTSQEELDRVLGKNWREDYKPRPPRPLSEGMAGTTSGTTSVYSHPVKFGD